MNTRPLVLFSPLLLVALAACEREAQGSTTDRSADRSPAPTHQDPQRPDARRTGESAEPAPAVDKAVCVLVPVGNSGVQGTVRFERLREGKVHVTGEIRGLTAGQHGFHVHEFGDLSDREQGKSAGDHFAGGTEHHGAPEDDQRHAGDLGNIQAGDDGVAKIDKTDAVIALAGPHSVLGRALVVHANPDKFTQPSGDAGGRVAFGVIGIAEK